MVRSVVLRGASLSSLVVVAAMASTAALPVACADLKTASDVGGADPGSGDAADGAPLSPEEDGGGVTGDRPDATSEDDAGEEPLPPGTGPGPHGALPSGYCCTDDSQCRYRRCVDTGGGPGTKMCLDECFQNGFCERPDITFTCEQPTPGARGHCKPPPGFTCLAQATFVRGTRKTGECCAFGTDGTAAAECDGNQCLSIGQNPYVCTNRCTTSQDCPGGFYCNNFGTSKACIPANTPYTCD
jgi:hypothetical protein